MEELMNGVKDARQLCARMPAPLSRPGVIRRARSVESQRQNLLRTHSQQPMMRKQFSDTTTCASPPLEEVDGEELEGEQHASASSLSSQEAEHKDNHVRSLSDSAGSPLFSSVSSLPVSGATYRLISHPGPFRRPASVSDFLDRHDSPTPIPELPEPPAHHRASTPHVCATYSPIKVHHRYSFRTRSSYVGPSPALSPLRGSPSKQSSSPGFFSLSDSNGHSWSSSSPQFTTTRVSKFNLNPRNHSQSSPPPSSANKNKKKGSPVLSQSDKDQELSYFRKNSLIHDNSFREGLVSFADDECELKGSGDNLSQVGSGSGSEYLTPTKTSSSSVILRRSSLTGQIEHVSHQKTQARRNSSYNTYLHSTDVGRLKETRMLSSSQGNLKNMAVAQVSNKAKNSKRKSKIIILNSKETTV